LQALPPDYDNRFKRVSETSGVTRLSKTDDETEGIHLKRVASELSGSNAERIAYLCEMLASKEIRERISAAIELGSIGSEKAVQILRELLVTKDEKSWRLAIHGLRSGGAREAWLCLESVAQEDAEQLGSSDQKRAAVAFRRLMAMGRTKMMDRLFRAADGHSKSILGTVARAFCEYAVRTLDTEHRGVMELRLGLLNGSSSTPGDTARLLKRSLSEVRTLELEAWRSIHSPILIDG
jgi:hypothetical protein